MQKLTPRQLLQGYAQGIFPMADDDGTIYWYDPHPRTIMPLDGLHISRRLARTVRQGKFEMQINYDFGAVVRACADREHTWLNAELIHLYETLHQRGFAHSIECWQEGELVGGIYGVALRGLFAGESMFSRRRDASKVAMVHLVHHLNQRGFTLFDVQFTTDHLLSMGAVEISRSDYHRRLAQALKVEVTFD